MTESNTNKQKICGVCGDIAIVKNFGAITCESCKSFFRRNALKNNTMRCCLNGKCVINMQNRKLCKSCRLNKCLDIGMIRELTLRNKDNSDLRINFSLKKKKKEKNQIISTSVDSKLFDHDFDIILENCCSSDEKISAEIMEIKEFINNDRPNVSEEAKTVDQKESRKISVISVVRPIVTYNKDLNDIELNRLEELSTAINCFHFIFAPFTQNIIEYSNLMDYYSEGLATKVFDQAARDYVTFCKRLSEFREICKDDQLALVKNGYQQVITWQNMVKFNFDKEYWSLFLGNGYSLRFNLTLLKSARAPTNIYSLTSGFFKKLSISFPNKGDWLMDPTIRNLLSAVTLFNPNRPNITHKNLIKFKQQMYLYLLQKYLIQKCRSECESMEKCSKILNSAEDLQVVIEEHKRMEKNYIEFSTPLLREFLD